MHYLLVKYIIYDSTNNEKKSKRFNQSIDNITNKLSQHYRRAWDV